MVKQEIKPTRTELIAIKRKIALYDRGYKLLKMKRDGLVLEFFNILSKARDIRSKIIADYKKADEKLIIATGVDGETSVHSVAFARQRRPKGHHGKQKRHGYSCSNNTGKWNGETTDRPTRIWNHRNECPHR